MYLGKHWHKKRKSKDVAAPNHEANHEANHDNIRARPFVLFRSPAIVGGNGELGGARGDL